MDNRIVRYFVVFGIVSLVLAAPQSGERRKYDSHTILTASEAEQVALTKAHLDGGMMPDPEGDALISLVLTKSSLVLGLVPIFETTS
jgi:hypothetical protein